jgi:FAD/FMN-containing dehydrogenase
MTLKERVGSLIEGDAYDDAETLKKYSRDTSILERTPSLVVFPKHAADVAALTKFVREEREAGRQVTLTARSAGTDMTGGPLTDSIVMVFTKYMNHVGKITPGSATTQPGVYYRDFEKETLAKGGAILPSYPASRELCAMGGIVNKRPIDTVPIDRIDDIARFHIHVLTYTLTTLVKRERPDLLVSSAA